MKIIDLLNKIANGEIPKHIRYNGMYMTYDKEKENYYDNFGSEIDWKYTVMEYINDEIEIIQENEILEEEKKIPEKIPEEIIVGKKQPTHRIKKIEKKINEIINYLDYLKSKGE